MNEFEGNMSLIIAKESGIIPDIIQLSPDTNKAYEYLIEKVLYTPFRKSEFREKVRDSYMEVQRIYSEENGEYFVPSQYNVADYIDEENAQIILHFLEEMGEFDSEQSDTILAMYTNELSYIMPSLVSTELDRLGIPYINNEFELGLITKRTTMFRLNPAQTILINSLL